MVHMDRTDSLTCAHSAGNTPMMQRVQLALDSDAPGRPAGPALGTEVPAKNWHWLALGTGVPAKDCHWPELGTPVPAPVQTLGTAALARSD